ncbi:caffeoyl-CoA O-methyltransferase [Litorivivens lipolytica]|uniref:Caffeoyl-CoA O-methyltransferase n=1 Tax=Litorivivens lipolytica TaxID=1524264 RepID=A0A7W4Z5A9_9GAMM|nr:class I SAM-dependent methyltransferase [Litorivivens lipolytica]MBB3047028.1 caffeoyl-CoA O-methyltransferase [Litorivivens lipolytica]
MSNKSYGLSEAEHHYLLKTTVREHPLLTELREETMAMPMARMQIAPEQAQFMQLLVNMLGATQCIEVGVFTGYSTLATALALPAAGRITACDISEEYTAVARRYWEKAGVDYKVDLRLAPASETLGAMITSGERDYYDFAFIDADKENYALYYEQCLILLRPGGLIAIDNALWDGRVAEDTDDEETRAIQAVNTLVGEDDRVECSLVPIGDGLLLARKL